ncbi:MAG TPA: hypothetical protein VK736_04590 [Candidatus Binatia bacterium]|nr:hypothetical protein [Candidatus Binatia bacterium]
MRRSGRVGWVVFALSLAAMVAALVVWAAATGEPLTPDIVLYPAAYVAFGAVGALIVSRDAANRIGRLALATGAMGSFVALCDSVARSVQPLPGQDWAAWFATWGFPATLAPPLMLILLFPTGRLASSRWRVAAALILVGVLGLAVGNAFTPRMGDYPALQNPVGIPAFAGSPLESGGIAWFPLLGGAIAAAVGLVPRLRRAQGIERAQLKWITFAATLQGLSWVFLAVDLQGTAGELAKYAIFATLLLIPVATGIAILRYRLYDIDIVIRRTLVYGVLVAILAGIYVALVVALQSVLSRIIGGDTIPVALSTLAIAVLFGPLRARVRDLVDRRFYRTRYDHKSVLEAFGTRLRDEVELDNVSQALTGVAGHAVHPTSVALWLRGGARSSSNDGS